MILSMSKQTILFAMTVGVGFVMGCLYDVFRILRKAIPHKNAIIQLEDLLYWLLISLLFFYFALPKNYGEIRLFAIAGAVIGMILYFCTLSILIMHVSTAIIELIKKIVYGVVWLLLAPIRFAAKILASPVRKVKIFFRKQLKKFFLYAKMKLRGVRKSLSIMRRKV